MAEAAGSDDASNDTASARVAELRACSAAERAAAIEQLGALLCATQAALLDVVTAADAEADWKVDGATGMAPWLAGTLHVSTATARDWVRTGAALDRLPHLREAFAEGMLSWDQVSPAATFVTGDDDERQARHLPGCSAAQIEDLARQHRVRSRREARRGNEQRSFRSRLDHTTGGRRCCAGTTTTSSTRATGPSPATPTASSPSRAPTAERCGPDHNRWPRASGAEPPKRPASRST